jgi:hypothetical protein
MITGKHDAQKVRQAINHVAKGPAFLAQLTPSQQEAYRIWAMQWCVPVLNGLLPQSERVRFPRLAIDTPPAPPPAEPHTPEA